MGVFDSIRDRFSESDDESDDQTTSDTEEASAGGSTQAQTADADSNTDVADDVAESEDASSTSEAVAELQSHANHWGALVPPEEGGDAVEELIETAAAEGDQLEGEELDGSTVVGHLDQDGPLGTMAVSVDNEVVTGYPIAEGVDQQIDVEQVGEWDTGVEGWLLGECGPATLSPFATNYFELDRDEIGGDHTASLAMVVYRVEEAESDTIETEDGEEVDVSDFAGIRPWNEGGPDEYVLRTTVEDVEEITLGEYDGYRVEAPLLRPEDGETIDAAFYVGEHVAGDYEPEAGDVIEGVGWLQAAFE